MATTYNHAQIGIVDASGNVNVIYPATTGADVSITANSAISSTATTVQALVSALKSGAIYTVSDSTTSPASGSKYLWSAYKVKSYVDGQISTLNSNFSKYASIGSSPVFTGVTVGGASSKAYIYSENGNINFRYTDSNGNIGYANLYTIITALNNVASQIEASKVKSTNVAYNVVTSSAIGNKYSGMGYTHYGCTAGTSKTIIDQLVGAGHTILGGFISKGSGNDSQSANNVAAYDSCIINYNSYYNCPYQIIFLSSGYMTIHCTVTILYI